jgi:iron complex outermembrane receptor protein
MTIRQRAHCRRRALFRGAAPLFLFWAGAAAVAEADPQAHAAADSVSQPAAKSGDATDAAQLGDIVVTAQRRTQQVQDVPIAMQVVTATQIDALAATDLSKMNGYVPGLYIDGSQPTQPYFSLRGINVTDFGIGTDSPIGIYEDGVYTGKTGGALIGFLDVQRIEVLNGPQGTLFGRNSAGGAISITTNEPSDKWEEDARVRFGNYGMYYVDAVLNAPINQDVALRLSAVDNQSNGWLRDAATGQRYEKNDEWGTRLQFRWRAPGDTLVRLIWEHEQLDQPARPAIGLVPVSASGTVPYPPNPDTYVNPITAPVYNDVIGDRESRDFNGVTLRIEHPFAFGDLASTTAYRHFNSFNRESAASAAAPTGLNLYFDDANIEQNSSWSQEFKLSGKTALADWLAGASYYRDNAHQVSQLNLFTDSLDTLFNNVTPYGPLYSEISQAIQPFGLTLLGDPWQESMFNHGTSKAYAAFGDVIWHLTDRLNLTTGVRFTRDEKEFSWYNPPRTATQLDATLGALQAAGFFTQPGVPPIQTFQQNIEFSTPVSTQAPLTLRNSWNDTSPRVVLDYKLTPDVMLYGSVAKGYQAGGYNSQLPNSVYQPEIVWNYEAGAKSYFSDYHLLLNASLYYYRFSNLQTLNLVTNGNGALPLYEVTISNQVAKGLDLDAHWQATEGLRLNLVAAYIDSVYQSSSALNGIDLTGQPSGEPLWSLAGGLDYVLHGVAHGDLDLNVQDAYRGRYRCNSDSVAQGNCLVTPTFRVGTPQNRTDLRLGWSSRNVPWSFALFVNNAFDKRYVTAVNNISASVLGTPVASISPPRMWGVEAAVSF